MKAIKYFGEYPSLFVADFRREYGISKQQLHGLDLAEFVSLTFGLSQGSRLVDELSKETATVTDMRDVEHRTSEEFAAYISRHPNAVVEVIKRDK